MMKTPLRVLGAMLWLAGSVVAQESNPSEKAAPKPKTAKPPYGIAADRWILIAPNLGFVITTEAPKLPKKYDPVTGNEIPVIRTEVPVVGGYFMVQQGNQWLRAEIDLPKAKFFRVK